MPFFAVSILVQVALIIHVVRTGRNSLWIWVLALLPMAGPLAYIAVEILPDVVGGRTARRAISNVQKTIDPKRGLREAHKQVRMTGSIDARRRFAEELLADGKHAEAIDTYRTALVGLYEYDPHLLLGLAQAQFASGDASGTRATLDTLIAQNPDFKSPPGHLLYARALEGEGNLGKAAEEYAALNSYNPGPESTYRHAVLLNRTGETQRAKQMLRKLLEDAELTSRHARALQKEWLDLAKRELNA
jgi:hypothetical protein